MDEGAGWLEVVVSGVLGCWSGWMPLRGAGSNKGVIVGPGLYRVRLAADGVVVYVGQTGRSLRGRLGQLNAAYQAEMPFSDPHTAAPALWALLHGRGCDFEVSVTGVVGTPACLKGMEAVAITRHRARAGCSPLANFGGMPPGYRKSTGNNARLAAAGRRARGGPDTSAPARPESAPVHGDLGTTPASTGWMNWSWSRWVPVSGITAGPPGTGLYRLRRPGASDLLYVGQGQIRARLRAHLAKASRPGHRQAGHFAGAIEASWVNLAGTVASNLLEHENDLIAAHVLACGGPPLAQFMG